MGLELRIVRDPCQELVKARSRIFGADGGNIGRAPDSYWMLPDPKGYVSAQHCSVEFRDGAFWLCDTSRNGVYVNGSREPVGKGNHVALHHGDRLRMAEYEVLVRLYQHHPDSSLVLADRNADRSDERTADVPEEAQPHAPQVASNEDAPVGEHGAVNGVNAAAVTETVVLLDKDRLRADGQAFDRGNPDAGTVVASAIDRLMQGGRSNRPAEVQDDPRAAADRKLEPDVPPAAPHSPVEHRSAVFDELTMQRNCVLSSGGDVAALSAYKILRTRMRRRMIANDWRSVGVTGAAEGAGKTLTAINVALVYSQDERSPAALVDVDLTRPKVAEYFGMRVDKGLSDYLLGEAEIGDIVYTASVTGLIIVPNGRPLQGASELLASPRMTDLVRYLESLKPQRTVIYDLPPLLMSDDVLVFSPHMDCLLDVVAVGVTPRASLERSKEILAEFNVVGVVLNRSTNVDKTSHYYY